MVQEKVSAVLFGGRENLVGVATKSPIFSLSISTVPHDRISPVFRRSLDSGDLSSKTIVVYSYDLSFLFNRKSTVGDGDRQGVLYGQFLHRAKGLILDVRFNQIFSRTTLDT